MQKAYKLLAVQNGISNKRAKELIDRGLVYAGDKKVRIARAEMPEDTRFRVEKPADIHIIYREIGSTRLNSCLAMKKVLVKYFLLKSYRSSFMLKFLLAILA